MEHRWRLVGYGPETLTADTPEAKPEVSLIYTFKCTCGEEFLADDDVAFRKRNWPCPSIS